MGKPAYKRGQYKKPKLSEEPKKAEKRNWTKLANQSFDQVEQLNHITRHFRKFVKTKFKQDHFRTRLIDNLESNITYYEKIIKTHLPKRISEVELINKIDNEEEISCEFDKIFEELANIPIELIENL